MSGRHRRSGRDRCVGRDLPDRREIDLVVAADDRPQAHRAAVFRLDHRVLLSRRRRGGADAAQPDDARRADRRATRCTTGCSPCMASSWCGSSWSRRSPSTLGNFITPLMLGARDLAFPRLNLRELVPVHGGRRCSRSPACSPAASTPAGPSTRRCRPAIRQGYVVAGVLRHHPVGLSRRSPTGLNFIVTIHKLRAPGMTWYRLPLFLWSLYSTRVICTCWRRRCWRWR